MNAHKEMSADYTATYSVVDLTKKKKTRLAAKKDKPPEIQSSDIPMYSEINRVSETSAPWSADTAFDNQVYSMGTSDNTYSVLNSEQTHQANPATPHDNMPGTKTASHREVKERRNLVWIVISVNILLFLAVSAVAVVALKIEFQNGLQQSITPTCRSSKAESSLSNSSASYAESKFFST